MIIDHIDLSVLAIKIMTGDNPLTVYVSFFMWLKIGF